MIPNANIATSAVEHIRNQIITGALPPGLRLNEEQLATELKISRPPLREAFRLLESERMVLNIPRKGTFVTELSVEDVEDLYQIREMMERGAIDILKLRNIRELPGIDMFLDKSEIFASLDYNDPEAIMRHATLSSRFHITLIEATGNSRLIHFYKTIASNVMRYKMLFLFLDTKYDSGKDHRRLVELIRNGDFDEAREFAVSHIQVSYSFLREEIRLRTRFKQRNREHGPLSVAG